MALAAAPHVAPTAPHDTTAEERAPPSSLHLPPSPPPAIATQAWDWVCWTGAKTYDGLDFAGEVLANFLGLTQSQYQWMIDLKAREEQDKQQRKLEQRQRRQLRLEQLLEEEKRKLHELEKGAPCPEEDSQCDGA